MTTAAIACAALTLWPPSSGKLLLVPIAGQSADAVAKTALAGDAALLGPGPFPGSLVVVGARAMIAKKINSWTIIAMAAPPVDCSAVGSSS